MIFLKSIKNDLGLDMILEEVLELIEQYDYHKIRAGVIHRFIDISIVIVEGRLFCRQYSFSKRSWYHTFQEDSRGAIQCGDHIISIKAVIPPMDLDRINLKINEAYLKKYGTLASMMLEESRMKSTVELIPILN